MKLNLHITRALNNLKKSPLKVTKQRIRLIEILFKNGDHHFTAEEVYKEVDKNKLISLIGNDSYFPSYAVTNKYDIEIGNIFLNKNISEDNYEFN